MSLASQWQNVCSTLQVIGLTSQLKEIRRSQSVYGLSFDYLVLSFVESLSSLVVSLVYLHSRFVNKQYAQRFPIHPNLHVQRWTILTAGVSLCLTCIISMECFKYRGSRHKFQEVSKKVMWGFSTAFLVGLLAFANTSLTDPSRIGHYGLFLIDIVDYVWLVGNVAAGFKSLPQVSTNFVGMYACPISKLSSIIDLLTSLTLMVCRASRDSRDFFGYPVNEQEFVSILGQFLTGTLTLYQFWVYRLGLKRLPVVSSIKNDQHQV